ncbi:SDR family oxidoreductase [Loigolactobacillus zhaoyuanensis]|uniref:SDR family oxidoreductase n=1 Tax=Loigolactobacillus zhaoyuanensis TaxID=2486017 RepID=UPI000F73A7CD|nr:SDR family oxidoreductase [Loigolactobacillus zhaoyuanensis]
MQTLQNKRILVLGGTSGFGEAIARQALQQDAQVMIVGRDPEHFQQALGRLMAVGRVAGQIFDVRDETALATYLTQVGPVDHIVSMVGGALSGGFLDTPLEKIRAAVETKFFTNVMIAQQAAPHLAANGSLIFTAGAGGHPHDASGAIVGNQAIQTLVQGLAIELAPHQRANAVAPTWTPTGLWRDLSADQLQQSQAQTEQQIPLRRVATTDEVASAYLYLMQNTYITGQVLTVDGGFSLI